MERRRFIQSVSCASMVACIPRVFGTLSAEHRFVRQIGLQLWTVRNQLATDVAGTIQSIADAGYYQIELSDVMKSDEVIRAAKASGLAYTSSFLDWTIIGQPGQSGIDSIDIVVEKAHSLDLKHLVFGYIGKGHRETSDHYRRHAENANRAGEKCRAAGIQLNYHNHSFEFGPLPDGTTGFDVFVKEFEPTLVKFELDVFWVQIGGRDAVATIKSLPGRIAQLHLKDLKQGTPVIHDEGAVPADAFKELGRGTINMVDVIKAGDAAEVQQCHVEQDQSDHPVQSIGISLAHIKSI